ncbi:transglycosylase SLT domain-containing protein [Mycobacterium paragordonae]|uniref:transglycosylase SLT domain-containing protein n=2 Tax=Mycobacterium TaxID=1763 RepID=UPI001F0F5FD6|nr:transglycosylase SLT domain-containing protein [Mycobacterium paragordonae]
MGAGVAQLVADVDRLLTRAHELFPASGGPAGKVFAAGGGQGAAPLAPGGASGLGSGVAGAAGAYGAVRTLVSGLDAESGHGAGAAGAVGQRGHAGSGSVRDVARAQAAAIGRVAHTGVGMRLMVSAMDERLGAMQRQIEQTTAQNRVLTLRLRQMAQAYQGLRVGGGGGGLSGLSGIPMMLGGARGGGVSGLSGLGSFPTSLLGQLGSGGASGGTAATRSAGLAAGAAGVDRGAIPLSEVSFEGKGVWPGGRGAIGRFLDEALDRMGISDPRARANWRAGMMTIAEHESSFRADAINLIDGNAHGSRQVDGGPLNSSRGPWQLVPGTFAKHHHPGTSNHIWDPVANACASMNYQMSRYGVARDGHNLRALVGQANPGFHHGY